MTTTKDQRAELLAGIQVVVDRFMDQHPSMPTDVVFDVLEKLSDEIKREGIEAWLMKHRA